MKNSRLEARVTAKNRANEKAQEVYDEMVEIFRPLVGTKICKADGSLLAKIKKLLPELPNTGSMTVYMQLGRYSLTWTCKACELFGAGNCVYEDATPYIGSLSDGVLTELNITPVYRWDYTAEEILEKREAFRIKQKEADEAKSALYPFGDCDR